jgi:hypothetical protein
MLTWLAMFGWLEGPEPTFGAPDAVAAGPVGGLDTTGCCEGGAALRALCLAA